MHHNDSTHDAPGDSSWEDSGWDDSYLDSGPREPEPIGTIRGTVPASRNDPCPCGSGRKYKKCCLGDELDNRPLAIRIAIIIGLAVIVVLTTLFAIVS